MAHSQEICGTQPKEHCIKLRGTWHTAKRDVAHSQEKHTSGAEYEGYHNKRFRGFLPKAAQQCVPSDPRNLIRLKVQLRSGRCVLETLQAIEELK